MVQLSFTNPHYLWYLITVPLMIAAHFYFQRYTNYKGLRFANFNALQRIEGVTELSQNYTMLVLR
ncbi:MAG: BatA domain-containing protein, partial [Halobacteriaceae archaeon]